MSEFHPLPSHTTATSASWKTLNDLAEARAKQAASASMPSLEHATMADFEHVYEPSDDTYLLLDGILLDIPSLQHVETVVELGCGSGVALVFLMQQLKKQQQQPPSTKTTTVAYGVDINTKALELTTRTAQANQVSVQTVLSDLGQALLPQLQHQVDVLLFNPPYVPTPDDEVGDDSIQASWAGGTKGRIVVDRAIPQIAALLRGVGYMITVDDNEPEALAEWLASQHGLQMTPWVRRRARNEYLTVQKIVPIRK